MLLSRNRQIQPSTGVAVLLDGGGSPGPISFQWSSSESLMLDLHIIFMSEVEMLP